jgi:hypothetical protein
MSAQINPRKVTDGLLVDFDATKSLSNYTTNLFSNPETLNIAPWSVSGTMRTSVITAPNGTTTGNLYIQPLTNNFWQDVAIPAVPPTSYTLSMYAKQSDTSNNWIGGEFQANGFIGLGFVWNFNFLTQAVSLVVSSSNYQSNTVTSVGNGWYRVAITFSTGGLGNNLRSFIYASQGYVYSGQAFLWGLQLEPGSVATEYFPVSSTKSPTTWTDLTTTASTPNLTSVQALVVAGGGGGGGDIGGGGGGGGVIYNTAVSVTPGTSYTATVGAGGQGIPFSGVGQAQGVNGSNSIFGSLTAIGGGGGAVYHAIGNTGGSGGGGSAESAGGLGTAGQGFNGGIGGGNVGYNAGGGGGAGGIGQAGDGVNYYGGDGGAGVTYDISGVSTGYGGGGGGGGTNRGGNATQGGGIGWPRLSGDTRGLNGTPNTGGGGGGTGGFGGSTNGGSGIVIIRYPQPVRATGGTITLVGNDVVHTFTSGTSSFLVLNSARSFNSSPTYSNLDGGFLTFNGSSSQSVSIPSNVLNTPYTGKTIVVTARMNVNFGTGFRGLVGNSSVNRNFNTYIYSDATGYRIHSSYGPNSVFSGGFSNYLTTLALGQWFTVAVTLDAAGNHNYYLNGSNVAYFTGVTLHQYINSGDIDYIGRADGLWYGDIAQARIYSRALSAAEILQNYQSIRSRFSAGGQLAKFDGSSLTGWTVSGVTVNAVTGNAAPSLYANISQVAYIPLATVTSFANTTITFDVNITSSASLCNLFFAADATGMGNMLRLEGRTGTPSGFMYPTTWFGWDSGPSSGPTLTASTWYNIKIQITSAGFATWYLNGTLQASTANVRLLGNYIGIHGDGAGTGAYFDNIVVYSGIV